MSNMESILDVINGTLDIVKENTHELEDTVLENT